MKTTLSIALAIFTLVSAACAGIIKPGTYKMKWVYTAKQDRGELARTGVDMAKATPEQRKTFNLVSDNGLWGSRSGYTVAMDESKGTGKGYDVAYVTYKRSVKPGNRVRVPLIEDHSPTCDYKYHSDYDHPVPMDVMIGAGQSGGRRVTSAVAVEVHFNEDQPASFWVEQYGYLEGSFRTDSGPLCVRLYDSNSTGILGDIHKEAGQDEGDPDWIILRTDGGRHTTAKFGDMQAQMVTGNLLFDNKLYSLKVAPTGNSITIGRYTGRAGKLAVKVVIGSRETKGFRVGVASGPVAYIDQPITPVNLPPGKYLVSVRTGENTGILASEATVVSGRTTVVKIGGPLALNIERNGDEGPLSAKVGATVDFHLGLYAGEDMYMTTRKAAISITGPDGQHVYTGSDCKDIQKAPSGTVLFRMPTTWKPGDYKITATLKVNGRQLTASNTLEIHE